MTANTKPPADHYAEARLALERIDIAVCMLRGQIMGDLDATVMKYLVDRLLEHQEETQVAVEALYASCKEDRP